MPQGTEDDVTYDLVCREHKRHFPCRQCPPITDEMLEESTNNRVLLWMRPEFRGEID